MKTLFDLAHNFSSCFEHNFSICEISMKRARLSSVPQKIRGVVLLAVALSLASCTAKKPNDSSSVVTGPGVGLLESQELLQQMIGAEGAPGAMLGMYVSNYLISESGVQVQGATQAVKTSIGMMLDTSQETSDSFALLQQLGVVLQVNVPDMLNRSNDRQQALDSYVDTLTQITARSKTQVTAMKQSQTKQLAVQHEKRAIVTQIQHELNTALQKQDYTTASAKQSAIVDAKAEQSKAETEVNQLSSTINLYNNLNQIADRRLSAIKANREILIAGLAVVNVPGIDDLNILKKANGSNSTNGTGLFGN